MSIEMKHWPEWDRTLDPELYDFYAEMFLEPGWAGQLTDAQVKYIRVVLQRKRLRPKGMPRNLRHRWGFRRGEGYVSEAAIKEVALHGDPASPAYNAHLVRQAKRRDRVTV